MTKIIDHIIIWVKYVTGYQRSEKNYCICSTWQYLIKSYSFLELGYCNDLLVELEYYNNYFWSWNIAVVFCDFVSISSRRCLFKTFHHPYSLQVTHRRWYMFQSWLWPTWKSVLWQKLSTFLNVPKILQSFRNATCSNPSRIEKPENRYAKIRHYLRKCIDSISKKSSQKQFWEKTFRKIV